MFRFHIWGKMKTIIMAMYKDPNQRENDMIIAGTLLVPPVIQVLKIDLIIKMDRLHTIDEITSL